MERDNSSSLPAAVEYGLIDRVMEWDEFKGER